MTIILIFKLCWTLKYCSDIATLYLNHHQYLGFKPIIFDIIFLLFYQTFEKLTIILMLALLFFY